MTNLKLMLKENRIWFICFGVLLIYILYLQQCKGKSTHTSSHTDTVSVVYKFDTVAHMFPVYIPRPQFVQLPSDTIKIPYLDSNYCKQIAMDYLSTRFYSDTLQNDSVDLFIRSQVSNNRIVKMESGYKLKFPTSTTTIIAPNRIKVFLGGNVGTDLKNFYAGLDLSLTDKKDFIYHAGVAFSPTGGQPIYQLGFGFKLNFNKHKK